MNDTGTAPPGASDVPRATLPPCTIDRSVRRTGEGGRQLLGGSPLRWFRLTEAGATLFDRVAAGDRVPAGAAVTRLVDRWIDAGVVHPAPDAQDTPFTPSDVTVVVPVRDRAAGVAQLLDSLARHTPSLEEVLVVDDGSARPEELEQAVHGATPWRVRVLRREVSGGPAAARNLGAEQVHTPLVAFLDSDCTVDEGWCGPLLAAFADPRVALAAPRVRAAEGGGVLARYEARRSPLDLGSDPARVAPGTRVSYVPSAACLVRLDAWRRLGGFDATLRVGEDVDLVWRLVEDGWRVRYVPSAGVHHEVRDGWSAWARQRVGYGTSAAALDRRHPGRVAPVVASPWSLGVWALVVAGQPLLGAAVAGWTTVQLRRRVPEMAPADVARLALGGHWAAGRQLAHAVVRVWWPVALPLALVSRRARRVLVVGVGWSLLSARRTGRARVRPTDPDLDAVRFAALTLVDEASYGAGVWWGCARTRSWRALLPSLSRDR